MADIDLKTETPDTSLPTTGFLFGADSQAAASPSVYSTQAVATALLGSTSLTGATVTTSQPVLDLAQTWNNAAVTFTGLKFNVATDSSASGSLLMDLQVGGVSQFRVFKSTGGVRFTVGGYGGNSTFIQSSNNNGVAFGDIFNNIFAQATSIGFMIGGSDTILTRRAAANLRLGAADAAAPVAQTLSVQSVVAGTTNTAGANLTITGSQGTGTGAGGSIIFQVAPAGSSGTAQNALATALTIDSSKNATYTGNIVLSGSSYNAGISKSASGYTMYLDAGGANRWAVNLVNQLYAIDTSAAIGFGGAAPDVLITRDAANTLALRNGANAQAFNVYNTFTDISNYERGVVKWDTNTLRIGVEAAGTGSNKVIELRNTGSRFVRMPTTGGLQFFNSASREVYIQWDAIGVRADAAFLWSSSSSNIGEGSGDTGLVRAAANIVRVSNGSTGGGALQLTEMTAPAAPATDNVRIYAEDNGSGKTRLMALFPTGAAVQIAIEP